MNNNRITALGHAGMGLHLIYPADTYESLSACIAAGADGTEIDVQMTKDFVPVAFHDLELSENTDMHGMVNDFKFSELEKSCYSKFPFACYSVMRLDTFFSKLNNFENYFFTFDCKLYSTETSTIFYDKYADALIALIDKYNISKQLTVESDQPDFLNKLKLKKTNYKLFYYAQNFEEGMKIVRENNFAGITIEDEKISKEQIEQAHASGIYIALWRVNSRKDNLNAIRKNPDYIQSDKIEHLVGLLE